MRTVRADEKPRCVTPESSEDFHTGGSSARAFDTVQDIVLGGTCRLARGPRSCAGEPPVSTERSPDGWVARARDQVANALAVARGGRSASAERMLREALGVFERRRQYAGATRAAATLNLVLRERGQTSKANDTLRQARVLYEVARDVGVRARSRKTTRWRGDSCAHRTPSLTSRPAIPSRTRDRCARWRPTSAACCGRVSRSTKRGRCRASVRGCRCGCRRGPLRSTAVAPCGVRS